MSTVAPSTTQPNTKNENSAVTSLNPALLTALQDIATAYNIDLWGNFAKKGSALSGDSFKGSFYLKP